MSDETQRPSPPQKPATPTARRKKPPTLVADAQIKHRDRVRDLAEVFTAAREVNAMLDLVAPVCRKLDTTFLEPACGNGNFLAEILRRKLDPMHRARGAAGLEQFEHQTLRALASIHGIDIDADNVRECRERLANIINEHHSYKANSMRSSDTFRGAVHEILASTIQLGDTLNGATTLTITEWLPTPTFGFTRILHNFDDLKHPERMPLWESVAEVHYADLARHQEVNPA